MVPEGHRLGPLHMGVPRHYRCAVLCGPLAEHPHQFLYLFHKPRAVLSEGQAYVKGHLVVAAAAGVQAFAWVSQSGGQFLLHEGMNILGVRVDSQHTAVYIAAYLFKLRAYFIALVHVDNALPPQHCGVGNTALYVLAVHTAVKGYAGVEIVGPGICLFFKAALP